jgi:hypothetical protein
VEESTASPERDVLKEAESPDIVRTDTENLPVGYDIYSKTFVDKITENTN